MRPAAIYIPGGRPASSERFIDRIAARSRRPKQPKQRFVDRAGREIKRPAVQGFAALYQTTFRAQGRYVFLADGCLDDRIYERNKLLLLDHNTDKQVGCSALGLEFVNTSRHNRVHGLAYRMPLDEGNPDSQLIYDTISQVERPCVSVGLEFEETEEVKAGGQTVLVVVKARLEEISLVKEGAVPDTSSSIVDLEHDEPWLFMAARSHSFVADKVDSNVDARAQRITDALRAAARG